MIAVMNLSAVNSYSQGWIQLGEDIDGEAAGDNSGNSIDLSSNGNIIAIAGWNNDGQGMDAGHVRVFENIDGNWTQVGEDIDGNEGEKKGYAVSLNAAGDVVALSTPYVNNNTGKVSIYRNIDGTWIQLGNDIVGMSEYAYGGVFIDLSPDGNQIVVSNHRDFGYIRIYEYQENDWTMAAEITGRLYNEQLGGYGLKFNDDASILAAQSSVYAMVRVFAKNDQDDWAQIGDSIPDAPSSFSLSADGTNVASGSSAWFGTVKAFKYENNSWGQNGNDMGGWFTGTGYGSTVCISSDGTTLLVSAPGDNFSTGTVRTYALNDGEWLQKCDDLSGEAQSDNFGTKLCLSSDNSILAVSAPGNDGNGVDAGHVRIFKYQPCSYEITEVIDSVCDNDLPYVLGTQTLNDAGTYTEVFEASNGCDSTVTLTLTVKESYDIEINDTIPAGELPYPFGSQMLNDFGTYSETFTSHLGCDSTVVLNLIEEAAQNTPELPGSDPVSIEIYPNPSKGIVTIDLSYRTNDNINVKIYNITGKELFQREFQPTEKLQLDLSEQVKGVYTILVQTSKKRHYRKLILY